MKINKNIFNCPFILIVVLVLHTSSCQKDDNYLEEHLIDIDGNLYHTIIIGTQEWMVENLKTIHYRDGTDITNIVDDIAWGNATSGAYCEYDNTLSNSDKYGRLYNGYAAIDSRNICPEGWHLPCDKEWTLLVTYLGGDSIAGDKLKEKGIKHWEKPISDSNNESGFTALPGGMRFEGGFYTGIGWHGLWWSSTAVDTNFVYGRKLSSHRSSIDRPSFIEKEGLSVRCLKD